MSGKGKFSKFSSLRPSYRENDAGGGSGGNSGKPNRYRKPLNGNYIGGRQDNGGGSEDSMRPQVRRKHWWEPVLLAVTPPCLLAPICWACALTNGSSGAVAKTTRSGILVTCVLTLGPS